MLRAFLISFVELAAVSPFVLLALRTSSIRKRGLLLVVAGLLVLEEACLLAPHLGFFASLQWNWQGKLLEILWTLLLGTLAPGVSLSQFGIAARPAKGSWRAILLVTVIALPFPIYAFVVGPRTPFDRETLLFELTIPGIAEESVFRGVFQSLLNEVFGKPWRISKASVGWGVVLTALLFVAGHVFYVDRHFIIHFGQQPLLILIPALLAGWLRERCESVWPGVVLHNLANSIGPVGSWLLAALR